MLLYLVLASSIASLALVFSISGMFKGIFSGANKPGIILLLILFFSFASFASLSVHFQSVYLKSEDDETHGKK